jgi:ABC-2 type transport system permease protein
MLTLAARELRSLFVAPLAWILLAVLQLLLAWTFLSQIEQFLAAQPRLTALVNAPGVSDLIVQPLFDSAASFIALLLPLLTMRALAEEYRTGTIELLLAAPLSSSRLLLGKYLALLCLVTLLVLPPLLMAVSLTLGAQLDWGRLAAASLGLLLNGAAFAAAGLFFSSLTAQPALAAAGSYGLLLLLWLLPLAGAGSAQAGNALAWLSPQTHLTPLLSGLVRSADLIYFLLFGVAFLALAIRRVDLRRSR